MRFWSILEVCLLMRLLMSFLFGLRKGLRLLAAGSGFQVFGLGWLRMASVRLIGLDLRLLGSLGGNSGIRSLYLNGT